ncbi:MAG TPA: PEP-CTERM sorting domain-containing protein [Chloroflexota bacterium]|nr:PEP-CTERM sorting domain-containing protein [Chloroflexota bacterium]
MPLPLRPTPITIPPSLAPGSTYFLAFVTQDNHQTATSSNIADYDAFVTAQANLDPTLAALGTTWKVIGSTDTVDAVAHDAVTGPVFRLDGLEVASSSSDLFDGDINVPIWVDQYGDTIGAGIGDPVWTGSTGTGHADSLDALGSLSGKSILASDNYTNAGWLDLQSFVNDAHAAYYGISGPLVVPPVTPVPEPATLTLTALGLAATVTRYRRRRSQSPS